MEPARIFLSYSHQDEELKRELVEHLSVLRHTGIELWVDDHIEAGADWEQALFEQIESTTVAVLLITEHFLNSEFILASELPALARRAEAGELRLFPVIATACAWKRVPWLARMNLRPGNGSPVWGGDGAETRRHLAALADEVAAVVERGRDRPRAGRRRVADGEGGERAVWYQAKALRDDFMGALDRLEESLEREANLAVFGTETVRRWGQGLAQVRERLAKDFTVVVVGHFKRGKSSLVNALLGTPVATVDVAPETVTFNEIRSGERLSVEACLADGGRVSLRPEELRRDELEPVLGGLPGPVERLEIRAPAEWLDGVCLVDTPGTGDLFQRFDRQVHDYLMQADAVLYLLSPLSPVSESERDFLELAVIPQDFAKVTFVANMVDKIVDERDLRRVLNLIRRRVHNLLPEASLFAVSALDELARQQGDERPLPERRHSLAAGFDALRAHLQESILKNRELIQLERAIGDAGAMLGEIEEAAETLRLSLGADRARLTATLESCEDEGSPLNRKAAATLTAVEKKVEELAEEACDWLEAFSERLAETFERLDGFDVDDLQRHFPFFLSEALRSALRQCIDTHRPAILALAQESREELLAGTRDLISGASESAELDETASRATFGQELWEEFDTADLLTQLIGSNLFRFGAEAMLRYSKTSREKQKTALFQRKLVRSVPAILEGLQEQARKLYRSLGEHLVDELAERQRQWVDSSRLALERARDLGDDERDDLSVPEVLGAVREQVRITRDRLGELHRKLGTSLEATSP